MSAEATFWFYVAATVCFVLSAVGVAWRFGLRTKTRPQAVDHVATTRISTLALPAALDNRQTSILNTSALRTSAALTRNQHWTSPLLTTPPAGTPPLRIHRPVPYIEQICGAGSQATAKMVDCGKRVSVFRHVCRGI